MPMICFDGRNSSNQEVKEMPEASVSWKSSKGRSSNKANSKRQKTMTSSQKRKFLRFTASLALFSFLGV